MRRIIQPFKELRRIEREFVVSTGQRLEIELMTGGSVEISGWNEQRVSVVARLGGWNWRNCQMRFEELASGLRVLLQDWGGSSMFNSLVRLEIKVPNRFDINIVSRGGNIQLDGVAGRFEGNTRGGALILSNLNGRVRMTTMGGDIHVTNSDLSGEVRTLGGEVFIKGVTGGLKGYSNSGHVVYASSHEEAEEEDESQEMRVALMGGNVAVGAAPTGANLSTMGGDIYVSSAARYVKAKTASGNININAVDGWVHASTMWGNIAVTMVGDAAKRNRDVILNSNGGDISLTLPEAISMTAYISLAHTINNRSRYAITSDFELSQEGPGELVYHDGTPRRYTIGSSRIAGGRNRITVKTINGNIFLRKGY